MATPSSQTGSQPGRKPVQTASNALKSVKSPGSSAKSPGSSAKSPKLAKTTAKSPAARSAKPGSDALRVGIILDELDRLYPDAHCELNYRSPFELLIAVILSAQCTDDRVNMITPTLFERFPTPKALAESSQEEVEQIIFSTGFYRNKAKNIRAAAKKLCEKFGGQVPQTMPDLLSLPGVARKTANVVLGTAFGIPSGVVVDTHIGRLSQRLGMTREEDPEKIERDLQAQWPQARWIMSAHRLIWHGRRVCFARKPSCATCTLRPVCPSEEAKALP